MLDPRHLPLQNRALGCVRGTLELHPITVRIEDRHDPHRVAHEGLLGAEATFGGLSIDHKGVFADEQDRNAEARGALGAAPVLEHQSGPAALQPAPSDRAVVDPLLDHGKPQPVDVEAERGAHVGDPEKRDGLAEVGVGRSIGHGGIIPARQVPQSAMARIVVPEAEALLDQEIPVLDKGFVRLVDYLGGDQRIVQAARVSYGAGTKTFRQDRGLIHYLLKHEHTSPFEQVVLTFHAKMPILVARQWVRHRTARLNEISGRYSVMKDEFYLPQPEQVRFQSASNKQARSDEPLPADEAEAIVAGMEEEQRTIYARYLALIERGVARELARANLPLSLYTEWYWQIDLHNLFHFLRLRLDEHAQYEIRVYAEAMAECARAVAPLAWEAFEEHVLGSVRFSRSECAALAAVMAGRAVELDGKSLDEFNRKIESLRSGEAAAPASEPATG